MSYACKVISTQTVLSVRISSPDYNIKITSLYAFRVERNRFSLCKVSISCNYSLR